MCKPLSYTELRADLMRLADEENKMRLALVDIQSVKSMTIAALVEAADKLMMKSFAEHDVHGEYKPKTNVEQVAEFMKPGRKCSNCGEPGHSVRTCTNERKVKIVLYGDKKTGTSRLVAEPLPPPVKIPGKRYC